MTTAAKPAKRTKRAQPQEFDRVDVVRRILAKSTDDGEPWGTFIASNPTDEAIETKLRNVWPLGARDLSVPCVATSMGTLGIWIGQTTTQGSPALAGAELLAAVRAAFAPTSSTDADSELLRRTFKSAHFEELECATDDELFVAINETFRKKPAPGERRYAVAVGHKDYGTAIWLDTAKPSGRPNYAVRLDEGKPHFVPGVFYLIATVRELFGIRFPNETKPARAETKPAEPETPIDISREIFRKPLKWFSKSPFDTRGDRPAAWLQELAQDLKQHGQLQPCLARPDGQHIAGWTRVEAAKLAGIKELDVRIVTCTDTQARRLVLVENAKRRDLTEREKCEAYCALANEYRAQGREQKELAKELGISESTLSNNLRLKSIPEEVWSRYEKGGLSTDQLRRIAVHADRPLFVRGFLKHLTTLVREDAQPEPHHFESSFERGIGAAFRPMAKDAYGGGRQFTEREVTEDLDVVEIEVHGHKRKMAGNVELWNKLNKQAKKRKQEKEAAAEQDPKQLTEAKKRQKELEEGKRLNAIRRTWENARLAAIVQRFSGKLNKADRELLVRLAHFRGEDYIPWGERIQIDEITGDDETYTAACLRLVTIGFREGAHFANGTLDGLVKWLQLNPPDHWSPTLELLSLCTHAELKDFAAQCEVLAEGDDLAALLLEKWPAGWIPDAFYLDKPKAKARKKTAK